MQRVQAYEHISPTDVVRRNCLRILCQVICFPNHFGTGEFKLRLPDKNAKPFDVNNYFEVPADRAHALSIRSALSLAPLTCLQHS